MSRVCQVTGKKPLVGSNVSHSNRHTKRRFEINLKDKRFWLEDERRWITIRIWCGHTCWCKSRITIPCWTFWCGD